MVYNIHMDTRSVIFLIIIGLGICIIIGYLGFCIQPIIKIPPRQIRNNPEEFLNLNALSGTVRQFFLMNYGEKIPIPSTLTAWGRGKIKAVPLPIVGPLSTPFTWTLDIHPGRDFRFEYRLTWFGRTFIIGGDEYYQEKGRFYMGAQNIENQNINLSEATLMWIYSLWLAPFSLVMQKASDWQDEGNDTISINVPFTNGEIRPFKLIVNHDQFGLKSIRTNRTTSRDGKTIAFDVNFSEHRSYDDLFTFPAHMMASWENEKPYLYLNLTGLRYNVDISEVIPDHE